jgi:hypothetical protein
VSLVSRLLGRDRPDADRVSAAVLAAVSTVPGVTGTERVAFVRRQYGSGTLSGVVDVTSPEAYDGALAATYDALVQAVGHDAERVVVHLAGRGPADVAYDGATLGLPAPPTGMDLAARYR